MRNAPKMTIGLHKDEPGLFECLQQFMRDVRGDPALKSGGAGLRTRYLQIKGVRKQDPDSGSSYVREHVQIFFNTIFWYLHEYYQAGMQENVMIIAAYGHAVSTNPPNPKDRILTVSSYVCGRRHLLPFSVNTSCPRKTFHLYALCRNALQSILVKGGKQTSYFLTVRCRIQISLVIHVTACSCHSKR